MSKKAFVAGTVRYRGEENRRWVYAKPGEHGYPIGLMLAEQFFDGRKWRPYDETLISQQKRG